MVSRCHQCVVEERCANSVTIASAVLIAAKADADHYGEKSGHVGATRPASGCRMVAP